MTINDEDMHILLNAIKTTKEHVEENRKKEALFILDVLDQHLTKNLLGNKKGMEI